jgi:YesN/AraC family two-component response regulator
VIITGHGTEQTAIEALQAGAVNYLKKPFSLKELRSVLDKLLGRVFQQKAERLPAEMIEQSYLQIRIPSNLNLLPGVLRSAHRLLESYFDEDHWHQIRLGIDEMVTKRHRTLATWELPARRNNRESRRNRCTI